MSVTREIPSAGDRALARASVKGHEAAMTAVEMANLLDAIDED